MTEVVRELPQEDVLYFADSIHCPYGRRPHTEIQVLSQRVVAFLLAQGAQIVVVACNTASAAALRHLRGYFDVPIVGMEPAVKPAAQRTDTRVVGVIATEVTFQGALFASLIERFASGVQVLTRSCPGLVEQVESGQSTAPSTKQMLETYLEPLLQANVDSLVLGCTHYPFLRPLVEEIAGEGVEVIDPSPAVARQTARVLRREGLLKEGERGQHKFYTTGNPKAFTRLLEQLTDLRGPVLAVDWVGEELRIRAG